MRPTPPSTLPYTRRAQNLRTMLALMLREMSSTYGRSPGGYIWAVIEPIAMVLVISVAFSFVLHKPSLGSSFVLFYATALMPFRMYQECQAVTASAVRYSKALLVYPVVSFADALFARLILAVLTQLTVSFVVLITAYGMSDMRLVLDPGLILASFGLAVLLGFGVGSLNCLLFEVFPIWKSLFNAAMRPLLLFSAVIYLVEDLPPYVQAILYWNPLTHITGISRSGLYDFYQPQYVSHIYVTFLALGFLFLGVFLLRKHFRTILSY